MKQVDYAKLSEQYASFLVAAGGVSITVLALVLSFTSAPDAIDALNEIQKTARVFLVAALITATVCCFIGAHMMAETAAFFTRNGDEQPRKTTIPLGRRLFVLATSNIFIAITLVLFSIVLLPMAIGDVELAISLKWISLAVFSGVVVGALLWMVLAAIERLGVRKADCRALGLAFGLAFAAASVIIILFKSQELWLKLTFIFIVFCTALSLVYFAVIFWLGRSCKRGFAIAEIGFFSAAITISYAFLMVACFKILWRL